MRKFLGRIAAIFLVLGVSIGTGAVVAPAAEAAVVTKLVGGSSLAATANNARVITHPATASQGIVVPASDAVAVAQAAAAAHATNATVIVSTSATNPAAVNSIVTQKSITQLMFVGNAAAFPASYRNAIDPAVTVKNTALNDSPFERSKLLAPGNATSFAVAKSSNIGAMNAALSYVSATDSALLVITGSEPAGALKAYLDPLGDPAVALIGDPEVSDQLNLDDADHLADLLVDSAEAIDQTYDEIVQQHVDRKGRAANKVSIAPGDDLASFALATLVGRAESSVTIPAGTKAAITTDSPADRYLKLLGGELKKLTLVGTATTAAQLTAAAAPSTVPRTTTPAWTVSNVTVGASSYTLAFTARPGAVRYAALEQDNTVRASTTTTSITLPGTPDYVTLAAYDSADTELERIFFRSNGYNVAADRPTAMYGTIRSGTAHLKILGAANVPRKIVRFFTDPYAGLGDEKVPPVTVAVTCSTSFTESGLDPEVQWTYEVVNLTVRTGSGCNTTAGAPIAGEKLPVAVVQLPLTQDPLAQQQKSGNLAPEDLTRPRMDENGDNALLPRPGQTLAEAARQRSDYNKAHPETAGEQNAASLDSATTAGATGWGYEFSYQGYIPEKMILGPAYSGDPSRPLVFFNGSGRAWWDVNNPHTKFDVRAFVGESSVGITKKIGSTEKYHCGYNAFRQIANCQFIAAATASTSGLSGVGYLEGSTTYINLGVSAANPLQQFSPNIDGEMHLILSPRSWTLWGWHDRMPVHQLWWAPFYSEGILAYDSSSFYTLGCLFGGPGCTAGVNVRL